jgi:hypothetical protein
MGPTWSDLSVPDFKNAVVIQNTFGLSKAGVFCEER